MRNGLLAALAATLVGPLAAVAQQPALQPFFPSQPQAPQFRAPGENPEPEPEADIYPNRKLPENHPEFHEPPTFWIGGEFLHFRVENGNLPVPVATTTLTPSVANGSSTVVLIGNDSLDYGRLSGARVTIGGWVDQHQDTAVEWTGFLLERGSFGQHANSGTGGLPRLDVPFFNPVTGLQSVLTLAAPGTNAGSASVGSSSRVWGTELNVSDVTFTRQGFRFALLSGFRYLDLAEDLDVRFKSQAFGTGTVNFAGQAFTTPAMVTAVDTFSTQNRFYGGQVGARFAYNWGPFFVDLNGKVALGVSHEVLGVGGESTFFANPGTTLNPTNLPGVSVPGGIFAVPSNSGRFRHNQFAVVPELVVKAGYELRWVNLSVGYNLIAISNVVRPGDQLDPRIDPRQVPLSSSFSPGVLGNVPLTSFNHSDFWLQGLSVGAEFLF